MFIAKRDFIVIPKGLYVQRNNLCQAFTYNPFGGYKYVIPSGFYFCVAYKVGALSWPVSVAALGWKKRIAPLVSDGFI